MNEACVPFLGGLFGICLGLFFFGGLWITIVCGLDARRKGLLFLISFLVRMIGLFAGFYWAAQCGFIFLLTSSLGCLMVRCVAISYIKRLSHESDT